MQRGRKVLSPRNLEDEKVQQELSGYSPQSSVGCDERIFQEKSDASVSVDAGAYLFGFVKHFTHFTGQKAEPFLQRLRRGHV